MAMGRIFLPIDAEQARRIQIPDRGFALSGTARRPPLPDLPSIQHQTLVLCGDDDPLTPHVNHRVIARLILPARLHTVAGPGGVLFCSTARMRSGRSSRRSCAARLSGWRCKWA
jgi:pimeloyl-ACP methyl ester carboxylesterase